MIGQIALASDDQNDFQPVPLCFQDKAAQSFMGLGLPHSVQVNRRVNGTGSARETAPQLPLQRRKRNLRRFFRDRGWLE
jgi:hypothetical protein